MVNAIRGEIEALVGGQKRKLRLGVGDLIELEEATDAGCMELARSFSTGSFRTKSIVATVLYGLNGAGARFTHTDVMKMLEEDGGALEHLGTCINLLTAALFSGSDEEDTPQGNAEAATET